MADLEYLISMNDKEFRQVTQRMEKELGAHENRVNRGRKDVFGTDRMLKAIGTGAIAGIGIAVRMVEQFAEKNKYAADEIRGMDSAWTKFKDSVAGDLTLTAGGSKGGVEGLLATAGKWRDRVVDEFAGLFKDVGRMVGIDTGDKDADLYDAAEKEKERLRRIEMEDVATYENGKTEIEREARRKSTDDLIRAYQEREDAAERLKTKFKFQVGGTENEARQKELIDRSLVPFDEKIASVRARLAGERRNAEREARLDRLDKEAKFAEFDFADRALLVQRTRLQHREREADLLAVNLEYDRAIAELERDRSMSDEDRVRAAERLNGLRATELELAEMQNRPKEAGARGIGGGLAGAGVAAMIFGSGAKVNDMARESLSVQKQQLQELRNINRGVQGGGAGTYAP